MLRSRTHLCAAVVVLGLVSLGRNSSAATRHEVSEIKAVSVSPGSEGPVLRIVTTRPITPEIQTVEDPLRLVIDLPGSRLATSRRHIPFRNAQIKGVRLDQYQSDPAVTRIVIDLAAPVLYTWDAMGDRLHIRIRADGGAKAKPPTVPGLEMGPPAAAVPVAVGTSGTLVETGSRVGSGSSVTAGDEMAVLRLARGGEVRVCPKTTVSVTTSATGKDLLLGMSSGALETHYGVEDSVDSVLTPDFRIVLPGPGEFNVAVSADSQGNTCVGSLVGSTSSAVIAELLGSGTYEVKPGQQVLFRHGRIDSVEAPIAPCGCPAAQVPVLRTSVEPSHVLPEEKTGEKLTLSTSSDPVADQSQPNETPTPKLQPSQESQSKAVEMPLVFSGAEQAKTKGSSNTVAANVPAAPIQEVANLKMAHPAPAPMPTEVVLPPAQRKASKGFFGKIKGFFGAIFH